jgi:serine/threonine-protein kinase RsbW
MRDSKKISITSELNNINIIERFVEEICDEYSINNNYFANIMLVITEAVRNSIIHGNKLDPRKKVRLSFRSKPFGLLFVVEDEGSGFDHSNLPDPTELEESDVKGTGLYLIRSLSDEVTFKDNGRVIEIAFKIASINYEISIKRVNELNLYLKIKAVEESPK